jgi:hypothetical protein
MFFWNAEYLIRTPVTRIEGMDADFILKNLLLAQASACALSK